MFSGVIETEDAIKIEIMNLTAEIKGTKTFAKTRKALHLVRRATLLRKIGKLKCV